jgi:Tfp pilus assembly protein PilX
MTQNKKEKQLTREESEAAFREAEASVFLEGYDLSKDAFFQSVKAKVLSGELTDDEACEVIQKHHTEKAKLQNK